MKVGATDCSGFVSWVHNNCGLYNNENICNATSDWAVAPGHKPLNLSQAKPGDLIILGVPGQGADGVGGLSNHALIYLGKLKNENGQMEDWIVECGGGGDGSWCHSTTKLGGYKTLIPLGSSDTW